LTWHTGPDTFTQREGKVMGVLGLIVLNIPVYLFLGWLAFDSKQNAAQTFGETIAAIVKMIFVPYWLRVALGMDTEGSWGIVPIAGFLGACALLTYGEYHLLTKWGLV